MSKPTSKVYLCNYRNKIIRINEMHLKILYIKLMYSKQNQRCMNKIRPINTHNKITSCGMMFNIIMNSMNVTLLHFMLLILEYMSKHWNKFQCNLFYPIPKQFYTRMKLINKKTEAYLLIWFRFCVM